MVTMLIGRATASLRAGRRDPERLSTAIAKHAHCAQRAPNRKVMGMHNGEHGTSAGNAVGALSETDALMSLALKLVTK